MLEQDYLMRILLQFAEAIRRSWSRAVEDRDPRDAANMLERAVATPPISTVPRCCRCRRSPLRASCGCRGSTRACPSTSRAACCWPSGYLGEAGEHELAALRAEQARALAVARLDLRNAPEELALDRGRARTQEADSTAGRVLGYGTGARHPSAVIEAPLDSDR